MSKELNPDSFQPPKKIQNLFEFKNGKILKVSHKVSHKVSYKVSLNHNSHKVSHKVSLNHNSHKVSLNHNSHKVSLNHNLKVSRELDQEQQVKALLEEAEEEEVPKKNRFKFASYSKQIQNLRIKKKLKLDGGEDEAENDSFFIQELKNRIELDLTTEFKEFTSAIDRKARNLYEVLFYKNEILGNLLKGLTIDSTSQNGRAKTIAFDSFLILLSALVMDLQQEMLPDMHQIFNCISQIVTIPKLDPNVLKAAFQTIACIFKYLAQDFSTDPVMAFKLILPLVKCEALHVSHFLSECFGSFMKRITMDQFEELVGHMLSLATCSLSSRGIALCFYEVLRHIDHQFFSKSPQMLKIMLGCSFRILNADNEKQLEQALYKTFVLVGHHGTAQSMNELWASLIEYANHLAIDSKQMSLYSYCLGIWTGLRKGSRIYNHALLFDCIQKLFKNISQVDENCQKTMCRLYSTFLTSCLLSLSSDQSVDATDLIRLVKKKSVLEQIHTNLCVSVGQIQIVFIFYKLVYSITVSNQTHYVNDAFQYLFGPAFVSYIEKVALVDKNLSIQFLAQLAESESPVQVPLVVSSPSLQSLVLNSINSPLKTSIDFFTIWNGLSAGLQLSWPKTQATEYLENLLLKIQGLSDLILESKAVAHVDEYNTFTESPELEKLLLVQNLFSNCLECLTSYLKKNHQSIDYEKVARTCCRVIGAAPQTVSLVESVAFFFDYLVQKQLYINIDVNLFKTVYQVIGKSNLSSCQSVLRLHTLDLLCGLSLISRTNEENPNLYKLLCLCRDLEKIPNTLDHEREKPIVLRRIESMLTNLSLFINPDGWVDDELVTLDIVTRYLISLLSVPFAPLWPHVNQALSTLFRATAESNGKNQRHVWDLYFNVLEECWSREGKEYFSSVVKCFQDAIPQQENESDTVETSRRKPKHEKKDKKKDVVQLECTFLASQEIVYTSTCQSILQAEPIRTMTQRSFEGFINVDIDHYSVLLVKFLGDVPSLVIEHSAQLMPLFFQLLDNDKEEEEEEEEEEKNVSISSSKKKILGFLYTLSKLTKPRKLKCSEKVYTALLHLLSNGDSRIQKSSFECILAWKHESIVKYSSMLISLTDDDQLREGLSTFDLNLFRTSIVPSEQHGVLEIIIRILYGKLVTKHGRGSKSTLKARRLAIFGFITTLQDSERDEMISLMLSPFKHFLVESDNAAEFTVQPDLDFLKLADIKKQIGFLNVVEDFIKQLRSLVLPCIPQVISVLIHMVHYADRIAGIDTMDVDNEGYLTLQAKQIRTLAIKRMNLLFSINVEFDFSPYIPQLYASLIDSRVKLLAIENTQAPSALLELFACWSKKSEYLMFLAHNPLLIRSIISLCSAKKVQESVILHVFSMIESIQNIHEEQPEKNFLPELFESDIPLLLEQCKHVLSLSLESHSDVRVRFSPESIPNRIIRILSRISVFVEKSEVAEVLLSVLVPFLKASSKVVPEDTKCNILQIFQSFYSILPDINNVHPSETIYYPIICQLFCKLETKKARQALLVAFKVFINYADDLKVVFEHLDDLNAMSTKRIDEPDFDRRLKAFAQINQEDYNHFSITQWKPILYNHFYYVSDMLEYSIRTSASFGVERFIEVVASKKGLDDEFTEYFSLIQHLVFPQIKKGFKVSEELVRNEWIKLWGSLIPKFSDQSIFSDTVALLGIDEENNFFSNIVHIQLHRRVKALRLAAASASSFSSSNANLIISIASHFVYSNDKLIDYNVKVDACTTIAACCGVLSWNQYYNSINRFLKSIKFKPHLEKILVRLVVLILDQFRFSTAPAQKDEAPVESDREDSSEDEDNAKVMTNDRIHSVVTTKLIPSLQQLLAIKDDESLASRTPLAIAIVKLLKHFPEETLEKYLPKVLLTLCHFLSSHLQSTRDSARATLVTISTMLGSKYLPFIITGMRTALTRGYQLHVLGYTLHAVLVENFDVYKAGSINSSIKPIVQVAMNDIFGETGKEREVQELKGKMREIKTTKSFETLDYLCRIIPFDHFYIVLQPLKEQMLESGDKKTVQQVEHVFRKLANGINANESIEIGQFMEFVKQLLSESLPLAQPDASTKKKLTSSEKRVQVLMKRSDAVVTMKYYEANVHMFIEFGLSLFLASLKKERIDLKAQEHLDMLDPLVSLVGKSLYSKHASIMVISFRILSIIVKFPLPALADSIPVFVKRSFQLIARSNSTDSELVQAVFKLLIIILRDMKQVDIPEKQICTLLALLTPDLENSNKQSTTFGLIRSILERRYVTNEVYDLMDVVSRLLVTSQSDQIRNLCRFSYLNFLIHYPHGHIRLRKQITYLIANLEYVFETGRISVLELFHQGLSKFSDEMFQEYSDMLFLSIVMVLANDESSKCREMAGILVKSLCLRLNSARMTKPLGLVEKWFHQDSTRQIACQVVGLVVEAFGQKSKVWIPTFMTEITNSINVCIQEWSSRQEAFEELDQELENWELGYFALKTLSKICDVFPQFIMVDCSSIWNQINTLLLHPHSWIRLLSGQLMGKLYSFIDPASRKLVESISPNGQLSIMPYPQLSEEMDLKIVAKKYTNQLDSNLLTPDLAKQVVKNLYFIGKAMVSFLSNSILVEKESESEDEENDELQEQEVKSDSVLLWLCKRMSYLARTDGQKKRGILLRMSVFQWFAAIYKYIPQNERKPILKIMILTLYLVDRNDTMKGEELDTLKQLASEVLALLQKETGTTEYIEVYQKVHERIQNQRNEKRTKRAIEAVSDPKAHAQYKLKKNTLRANARKRKAKQEQEKRRLKIKK